MLPRVTWAAAWPTVTPTPLTVLSVRLFADFIDVVFRPGHAGGGRGCGEGGWRARTGKGTQFTCFTGTKAQTLTQKAVGARELAKTIFVAAVRNPAALGADFLKDKRLFVLCVLLLRQVLSLLALLVQKYKF